MKLWRKTRSSNALRLTDKRWFLKITLRPERKKSIERLVRAGRLHVGPWYVQMDEFLGGDETLIRNLIIGMRIAAEFGGGNACWICL